MIASILYSIIIGLLSGLIWSYSLNTSISMGLIYGVIIFIIIGIVLSLIGKMASSQGDVTKGENNFVSNSFLTMLGIISIILGLIVWIVRVIF